MTLTPLLLIYIETGAATPATPVSILRNGRNVTFSDTPDAAATPSSFFATPTIPTAAGVAGASSFHSPAPGVPPMKSTAKKPSPPPPQRKKKTSKVQLDTENTDFEAFFIAPKSVKVESRTVAPMIVLLPHTITSETDIVVIVSKTECKVTFTIPAYLVNPKHMCPVRSSINKGSDRSGVTHNSCVNHLESLVDKAGDPISYDIYFDLPFECSPYLASDLLPGHVKGDIPVAKSYVGPEWHSAQDVKQYAKPDDWVHTLVLLFEKVDSGFLATKKVNIQDDSPGKSSEDDWEW